MGKSKAAKAQVPECRYGAACTRKDCIFRHPPKKEQKPVPADNKSDKVCFAFVAGRCAFGKFCHDRHPDQASCNTIRARYSSIDCQWGRGCRTDGCLYRHPSDEPAGPAMPKEPPKPQPAVFAGGPTIVPNQAPGDAARAKAIAGRIEVLPIPKAISQAVDLRDAGARAIADPLERFLAVNARNTGTQSAALLDLHFQSAQTVAPVLDDALPERVRMFQPQGVWLVTGSSAAAASSGAPATGGAAYAPAPRALQGGGGELFHVVREYLVRQRYDFAIGQDDAGQHMAFLVKGRRKRQDPIDGVRAVVLCGAPGSGKSVIAEALARKSLGRFVRVCQEEPQGRGGGQAALEEVFRKAVAGSCAAADAAKQRAKSGSWWWEHAFSPEKFFLALCFRGPALAHLSECLGAAPGASARFHATLAYQPTALDLRRLLGRPHRVSFRAHLVLEATFAPHEGEQVEVIICAARALDGASRPVAVYLAPAAPQWAARHLQVLNAIPLDKRIMTNSSVGSFKVRSHVDLTGRAERSALCLLVHKTGEHRGMPAAASFDSACLLAPSAGKGADGRGAEWTELADAALASLSPLVILEDAQGARQNDWAGLAGSRCAQMGFLAPELNVSRPMGHMETKIEQWTRLRSSCMLHCASQEADVQQILRSGAAALHRNGRAALPPQPDSHPLPPVVVLDRCNATRAERNHWASLAGLQKSQVIAVHLDIPEAECVARVAGRLSGSGMHTQHQAAAEAAAMVRPEAERFEAPVEREGFRAIVRLKGSAAAAQELVRRWTEEGAPSAGPDDGQGGAASSGPRVIDHGAPQEAEEEEEAPPPALPMLSQWIEVEEQGGRKSMWGVPFGCPVDAPLEGLLEDGQPSGPPLGHAVGSSLAPDVAGPSAAMASSGWGGPLGGLQGGQPFGTAPAGGPGLWHPLEQEDPLCGASARPRPPPPAQLQAQLQDEDAEESARQEQLAATLRCMGFDEEPSHYAAQRAGGNLNVAIESVLRSSGAG